MASRYCKPAPIQKFEGSREQWVYEQYLQLHLKLFDPCCKFNPYGNVFRLPAVCNEQIGKKKKEFKSSLTQLL